MITDPNKLDAAPHRATLLFSGGFDSTLVALLLKQHHIPTIALSFNYLTRPAPEIEVATRASPDLGFERHVTLDLPMGDFRNSPDLWPSKRHEAWFPYRNVTFFGIAAHFAVRHRCDTVAAGIRIWDDFDDASSAYFRQLELVLQHSGSPEYSGKLSLFLPLIKGHDLAIQALTRGGETERLLRDTWSCWRSAPVPCGECSPCIDRRGFFEQVERMQKSAKRL